MEINGEDYRIIYDPTTVTFTWQGFLRLYGTEEYTPIVELLNKVADQKPATITLNLQELKALNSPGINSLSNFVLKVGKDKISQLVIQGSHQFPWHSKLLKNLQRLMPELKVEFK